MFLAKASEALFSAGEVSDRDGTSIEYIQGENRGFDWCRAEGGVKSDESLRDRKTGIMTKGDQF